MIPPTITLVFQGVIAVASVVGLVMSLMTFSRQGAWRRAKEQQTERQTIETKISIVDDEARARVAKVEGEIARVEGKIDVEVRAVLARMEQGDGELRNALQGLGSRVQELRRQVVGIDEKLKHVPTHADLSKVAESIAANRVVAAENGGRIEAMSGLLERVAKSIDRLEEHHLK